MGHHRRRHALLYEFSHANQTGRSSNCDGPDVTANAGGCGVESHQGTADFKGRHFTLTGPTAPEGWARRGETIVLFGTGKGVCNPAIVAPEFLPDVTVGGSMCQVQYHGPASWHPSDEAGYLYEQPGSPGGHFLATWGGRSLLGLLDSVRQAIRVTLLVPGFEWRLSGLPNRLLIR